MAGLFQPIPARNYVLLFALAMGALLPIVVANFAFLRNTGELLAADEVVRLQVSGAGLYGTAVNPNTYRYKLALYRQIKPNIVAVGSSRVMQFRQAFFSTSFANMGGGMNSLREGEDLVRDMMAVHVPEIMILGLDFWWFDDARIEHYSDHARIGDEVDANKLLFPFESLVQGKVTPGFFFVAVVDRFAQSNVPRPIGVLASVHREGYDRDGSYYYAGTVLGYKPSADRRFALLNELVNRDPSDATGVHHPRKLDSLRVSRLRNLVRTAHDAGVKVLAVLPPMAPSVLEEMKRVGVESDFAARLRSELGGVDLPLHDFSDARALGSGDCEFIDGSHGGDVVYLRMAAHMARSEEGGLQSYVDMDWAHSTISRYAGLAMIPGRYNGANDKEVDFLDLGCPKEAARQ